MVTLNRLAVHPTLVSFAESALGSTGLMMSQCELIGKYGGRQYDQELHTDYDNNTLAFPGNDLVEVNMITYLTEVTEDLGPTFVVSREDTGDGTDSRQYCPRKDFPKLYQQEIPVTVPAGSTLIYTMRTVHRGSAMRAQPGLPSYIPHGLSVAPLLLDRSVELASVRGNPGDERVPRAGDAAPDASSLASRPLVTTIGMRRPLLELPSDILVWTWHPIARLPVPARPPIKRTPLFG